VSLVQLSPGAIATLACLLEVSAPKPGNVHRGADFEDVSFVDFATSAVVLGEMITACGEAPLGETVLQAVKATQAAVGTNTNLGMILLLVPLAKIAASQSSEPINVAAVNRYLETLTPQDCEDVFAAIRMANPGGLGESAQMDVNREATGAHAIDESPPQCLLEAMALAADRDDIAQQYVSGFAGIVNEFVELIAVGRRWFDDLPQGVVYAHVVLMARYPDSLIARKCGLETAQHSQMLAARSLESLGGDLTLGEPAAPTVDAKSEFWHSVGELDFWLRSDGHRRNPGTTADLIAASLFVGIHNGVIESPFR
jgi:triphosphoribosyl-dephospho-CoA synthase